MRSSPDSTKSRRVGRGPAADTPLLRHYLFRRVMIMTAGQEARNILPPLSTANHVAVPTYGELTISSGYQSKAHYTLSVKLSDFTV